MCNGTWVCFDCRLAVRRRTWRWVLGFAPWLIGSTELADVRCSKCHKACHFLGPAVEIPPKRDVAAWTQLRDEVSQMRTKALDDRFKGSVRRRHDLEQKIREFQTRPANSDRDKEIKKLREQLAAGA